VFKQASELEQTAHNGHTRCFTTIEMHADQSHGSYV
jgi:hypothetical protein